MYIWRANIRGEIGEDNFFMEVGFVICEWWIDAIHNEICKSGESNRVNKETQIVTSLFEILFIMHIKRRDKISGSSTKQNRRQAWSIWKYKKLNLWNRIHHRRGGTYSHRFSLVRRKYCLLFDNPYVTKGWNLWLIPTDHLSRPRSPLKQRFLKRILVFETEMGLNQLKWHPWQIQIWGKGLSASSQVGWTNFCNILRQRSLYDCKPLLQFNHKIWIIGRPFVDRTIHKSDTAKFSAKTVLEKLISILQRMEKKVKKSVIGV